MKHQTLSLLIGFSTKAVLIAAGIAVAAGVETAPFLEQFDGQSSSHLYYDSGGKRNEATHQMGVPSSLENESTVLKLAMDPEDAAGAWQGPNFTSQKICHYGTYAARIKIPEVSSQPKVGGVVGFYTFYNDSYSNVQEKDINQNGLPDNSEIDFEWLIADPTVLYLSAFTDFDDATGATKRVNRILNLAKGRIYSTTYAERLGGSEVPLQGAENLPDKLEAIEGFDASAQFYTYGFDWYANRIRWWIIHPTTADTVVLWDYRGPRDRITQKPAYLMANFWHTSDWSVVTVPGSTQRPTTHFEVEFDWISYTPSSTDDDPTAIGPLSRLNRSGKVKLLQQSGRSSLWKVPLQTRTLGLYDATGKQVAQKRVQPWENEVEFLWERPLQQGHYWLRAKGEWGEVVVNDVRFGVE